jgi:hypothetical protein
MEDLDLENGGGPFEICSRIIADPRTMSLENQGKYDVAISIRISFSRLRSLHLVAFSLIQEEDNAAVVRDI